MATTRSGLISKKLKEKASKPKDGSQDMSAELTEGLKKTELGQGLLKNKNVLIAGMIAVVALALGISYFIQQSGKSLDEASAKVFRFETTALKEFREDKIKAEELLSRFQTFKTEIGSLDKTGSHIILVVADSLNAKGESEKAISFLNENQGSIDQSSVLGFLMNLKKAVLLENTGKTADAIATLQGLTTHKTKTQLDRIHFDLGRLNLQQGNKEAAKTNFNKVVNEFKDNDQLVKMAKYHLRNL